MAGTPRTVSVVIPTYRKSALLARTLTALAAQTYPRDAIEVVVVDDASRDGTADILATFRGLHRLVALAHERNKGRAAARNTAVRAATGELVVFLDDDMEAIPSLVEEHARCHDAHPQCAVVGNALTAPELGPSNVFRYLDSRGVHKLAAGEKVPARYFLTNNSSVPRDALVAVGLFDEAFRSYGFEDTEIAFRLEEAAGLGFAYCPAAVAYHIHSHSLSELLAKREEAARSSLAHLLSKHPDRARELSVQAIMPPTPVDPSVVRLRKRAWAVLLSEPMLALARRIAEARWSGALALTAMDFLIAGAYRRGLAQANPQRSV